MEFLHSYYINMWVFWYAALRTKDRIETDVFDEKESNFILNIRDTHQHIHSEKYEFELGTQQMRDGPGVVVSIHVSHAKSHEFKFRPRTLKL